jgi:geranylgeranyl diphosphate synthase type I
MHRRFEELHRNREAAGDSVPFGNAAALLIGDLALVLSNQALNGSGLSDDQLRRVNAIYDTMKVELMAGQYLDMHAGSRREISIDDALKIATFKSGKYTIERPLHFGGALAGASKELMDVYSDYGIPLGIAFQLRDDLLGVFGDSSVTGKPAGDDLLEGKRTALISFATKNMSSKDQESFYQHFGNRGSTSKEIDLMRKLISQSRAVEFIEKIIEERTTLALAAAQSEIITPAGRDLLRELAIKATQRSA